LDFLTREVFDTLIVIVILIGLALAAVRLYTDFTRPLPEHRRQPQWSEDDTQPHPIDQNQTQNQIENRTEKEQTTDDRH
jgi:cytochrome c oxidase assembly protein Cox11